jgi:hypothetical protein
MALSKNRIRGMMTEDEVAMLQDKPAGYTAKQWLTRVCSITRSRLLAEMGIGPNNISPNTSDDDDSEENVLNRRAQ